MDTSHLSLQSALPPHRRGNGASTPEAIEAARRLVETTTLPLREIAARVGMGRSGLSALKSRRGWRRPVPERVALRGQRGGGHAIVPERVAEARGLLEETRLSFDAVAERTGISATTLCRWCKRGAWLRPGMADRPARPVRYRRGRGTPYAAEAVGMARRLVTTSLQSQKQIARQVGVSQAQISVWIRERGWERPAAPPRSKRFAASARTGALATSGDRRGRPYDQQVRREARVLWELTRLSTALIGARLGAHPGTIARWAREESWERPHGRAGRNQLRGYFGMLRRTGG